MSMNKSFIGSLSPAVMQGYFENKGLKDCVKEHITGIFEGKYGEDYIVLTRITRTDRPIDIIEYYRSKKTPPFQPVIINLLYLKEFRFL